MKINVDFKNVSSLPKQFLDDLKKDRHLRDVFIILSATAVTGGVALIAGLMIANHVPPLNSTQQPGISSPQINH